MISENITDTVKRTCKNCNSFNFQQFPIFINDNIEYLQVLVVYKLKISAKLQEKTLVRWDISIHYVSIVSFVNLQRFRAGLLCFDLVVFSCGMVLLVRFLSRTRIHFIYVSITYAYVIEFTLADPT